MEVTTPSTPHTSSDSTDVMSSTQGEGEEGSENDWRDRSEDNRPVFIMGDEEISRYTPVHFQKNLDGQKIRVGICAMAKKANSKPMKEILMRLERFEHLQIEVFEESMITKQCVEEWPVVDALIAFFSHGFPLQKAIQYKNLHKPFVINDLEAQYALKDRREVYKILVREGISHPRYAVMNRDEVEKGDFEENEDAIEVNGTSFQRPFVEKPVNAEDHNIYIYFPVSAGGGCQRLFRKVRFWEPVSKKIVGSRSSVYSTIGRVRKAGSYIYEDFMPTDGTDVKVYTVGLDYVHAEARKSPALDGKVERDKEGKEVRYPVLLSSAEKMIARKVCRAFKQNVCGFDLLRTGGKSYVCDVNGFSFVKNSTKYYDDCANVLGTMIVRALAPQLHIQNVALVLGAGPEDIPVVPTTSGSMMELRCVIAVIRHGDRTPKQKMKMEVKHKKFFELFERHNGYKKGHLKLKKPKQLQEVLDIARDLLSESGHDPNPEVLEKKAKLRQLKLVLEMYGHFSGINRKVQLKYQPHGAPKKSSSEEGLNIESVKYLTSPHEYPKEPSLVLILKWGGELTPAGKYQAEDLGKAFRTLYPGGQGEFETPGLGFLRLHSTYRHDLKIYASDEGRVQMTAAAFTKGLLALEGELTPILVSMVKSANTNGLLDKEGETSKYQHVVKERLMDILNQDREFTAEDEDKLAPTRNTSLLKAMEFIKNPKKMCDRIYDMVQEITAKIKTLKMEIKTRDLKLYHGESWELLIRRWAKLEKDFKLKTDNYDISKIPDIYDCIKYDLQHNQKTLQFDRAEELFLSSKALADIVIPQEYGITVEEKLHISQSICTPLMRKIHSDLHVGCLAMDEESTRLNSKYSKGVSSPERFVRTRLYFTSESHIHSLLNMLRFGGLCEEVKDEQWKKAMDFLSTTPELNYMTQINIMMFEDPSKDVGSPEKFHVELHFSPGAYTSSDKNVVNPAGSGYRTSFLVRQSKKGHESGVKHKDGPDDQGKAEIIQETITEESYTEESIVLDNLEIEKPSEDTDIAVDKGVKESKTSEKVDMPKEDKEELKVPHITLQVNSENIELESPTRNVPTVIGKDLKDIENDAVNEEQAPSVNELVLEKAAGTDENIESVGSQCDIEDSINTDTGIDKPSSGVNVKDELKKLENEQMDTSQKIKKKFDVSAASQSEVKRAKVFEKPPAKKVKAEKKDIDASTHDEVMFDDAFSEKVSDDEHSKTITNTSDLLDQSRKGIPQPKSPDPDIPEWDWDDASTQTEKTVGSSSSTLKSAKSGTSEDANLTFPAVTISENSVSKPIQIHLPGSSKPRDRAGSFEGMKSFEEKRSRSLEDHENKEACLGNQKSNRTVKSLPFRYSLTDVRSMDLPEHITTLEKHYCTIHLPIKDSHHSFSSLLYLNPEAFKGNLAPPDITRFGSYSSPAISDFLNTDCEKCRTQLETKVRLQSCLYFSCGNAFDGFNMVPSLKPLETLHNNLTMRDLDAFLSRATTTKFFTPVSSPMYGPTPLASPRCPELKKAKSHSGPSLPSSSNSSAGPSSPTSASTPVDFINKLRCYIIDSTKNEQQISVDNETESEPVQTASANQKQDCSDMNLNQPIKIGVPSETQKQTDSQNSDSGAAGNPTVQPSSLASTGKTGHQSAFKMVSRSNSQKKSSVFYVSQVSEDSLDVNKSLEQTGDAEMKTNQEKGPNSVEKS
ncbi:inositol hexakisphosphate and diphosphoinositol-pentakisphosphate kinase 2-like isoform X6 [Mercenaria mercenaria]|uniref:inositol hexakisphosphate and diphosphoinositol-pentakisphosphate kinase 2-like isoform X6 n=1 Tax=Mercenaria mercenaria TaxID=6596 RepID=UPI00234FAEF3|nr:inositol hexakisphosphate and diphosphoinositol-pentakisphosphate kinase 2-like isoform X6 [Mercenaria mercenaria]